MVNLIVKNIQSAFEYLSSKPIHTPNSDLIRSLLHGLFKSYAVIGYPDWQDGVVLPARGYLPFPARKKLLDSHLSLSSY